MWRWLTAGGVLVVGTGLLPADQAQAVLLRVWPVLMFLTAITVVAELADAAGLFSVAADRAARLGRGSVPMLFLLTAALATATTTVLSLDTTAVLLTPIVLTLTARLGLPPAPFAVLTLWLANTASLLLPVSNLTNLLAADRLARLDQPFTTVMAAPAAAVLAVSLLILGTRYRRQLTGRYTPPVPVTVLDRMLLVISAAVCLTTGALFALGADVAVTATGSALILLVAFTLRARQHLRVALLPWRLVLTTLGLFLLVQTALHLGARGLLTSTAGTGTNIPDLSGSPVPPPRPATWSTTCPPTSRSSPTPKPRPPAWQRCSSAPTPDRSCCPGAAWPPCSGSTAATRAAYVSPPANSPFLPCSASPSCSPPEFSPSPPPVLDTDRRPSGHQGWPGQGNADTWGQAALTRQLVDEVGLRAAATPPPSCGSPSWSLPANAAGRRFRRRRPTACASRAATAHRAERRDAYRGPRGGSPAPAADASSSPLGRPCTPAGSGRCSVPVA